jgi:hypothetical protein
MRESNRREPNQQTPKGVFGMSRTRKTVVAIIAIALVAFIVCASVLGGDNAVAASDSTTSTSTTSTTLSREEMCAAVVDLYQEEGDNPLFDKSVFSYQDVFWAGNDEPTMWYQDCLDQRIKMTWQQVISFADCEQTFSVYDNAWRYPLIGVLASNTSLNLEQVQARAKAELRTLWAITGDIPDLPVIWANGFYNTNLDLEVGQWSVFEDNKPNQVLLILLFPRDAEHPLTAGFWQDRGILVGCGNPFTLEKRPPSTTITIPRTTTTTVHRSTTTTTPITLPLKTVVPPKPISTTTSVQ